MSRDDDPWFDRGADGSGGGMPVVWQGWAMIGIFIGFLMAAQLLIPRSSAAYYPAFGVGAAIFLAFYAGRTRIGRRWRERLKAALSGESGRARRTRRAGRARRR